MLSLTKRQKIVIAAFIISIGLLSTQMINFFFLRTRFILGLGILAYLISLWALWEGITKLKAVILLILPVMFTLAVASFYFLLPVRWLTRVPVAVIFGLSFYSLLLSQNVFNVASIRTIPLYRAASTVSFLFTLITAFFLYSVVFSLNFPFYWNAILTFIISTPLTLQLLWSIEMEKLATKILISSLIISLLIAQLSLALSFWPVATTIWSLFLASAMYVMLGTVTEHFRDRLSKRLVFEYVTLGFGVFLFTLFTTSWTG